MRARRMLDVDTVVQLYTGGDSTDAIARRLHCGRSTVSQHLREAGVEMRPRTWRGPGASNLAEDLTWMDEGRPRWGRDDEDYCCDGFRRGAYAASVLDPHCCVRCAPQRYRWRQVAFGRVRRVPPLAAARWEEH